MPTTLPIELFYTLGSAVLALVGLVWSSLLSRMKTIEKNHSSIPFHALAEDVAVIKRDIEWIKKLFEESK